MNNPNKNILDWDKVLAGFEVECLIPRTRNDFVARTGLPVSHFGYDGSVAGKRKAHKNLLDCEYATEIVKFNELNKLEYLFPLQVHRCHTPLQ